MTSWRKALIEWNKSYKPIFGEELTLEFRKGTKMWYCFVAGKTLSCDHDDLKPFIPRLLSGETVIHEESPVEICYGYGKYLGSRIFKSKGRNLNGDWMERQYHVYDFKTIQNTTGLHETDRLCGLMSAHEAWFKLGEWTHNKAHLIPEKIRFFT